MDALDRAGERRKRSRMIAAVNAQIPLAMLLQSFGYEFIQDPGGARSIKLHCPWGHMHSDFGHEKSFRIYEEGTAWCFAGCGYFNSVRAAAKEWDIPEIDAAEQLAVEWGVKTGDLDSAVALMATELVPDRAALVDALRTWVDSWWGPDSEEYVLARRGMARCAAVVELVSDAESAQRWLNRSKELIREYVRNEHARQNRTPASRRVVDIAGSGGRLGPDTPGAPQPDQPGEDPGDVPA